MTALYLQDYLPEFQKLLSEEHNFRSGTQRVEKFVLKVNIGRRTPKVKQDSKHAVKLTSSSDRVTSLFIKHHQCSDASIFALLTHSTVYLLAHSIRTSIEFTSETTKVTSAEN